MDKKRKPGTQLVNVETQREGHFVAFRPAVVEAGSTDVIALPPEVLEINCCYDGKSYSGGATIRMPDPDGEEGDTIVRICDDRDGIWKDSDQLP